MLVTPAATLALVLTLPLAAQVNVLTYQYDNTRAGANRSETLLTPVNVNSGTFGKLFSYPVDGYHLRPAAVPGERQHSRQGCAQRGLRGDAAR